MSYKTILVHLNDKRRVETVLGPAIHLAIRHNAHLIGLHVHASMPAPPIAMAYGAQVLGSIVAAERKEADLIAAAFAAATANQPFVAEWRSLKVPHVDLAGVVMDHGRAADRSSPARPIPTGTSRRCWISPSASRSRAVARCWSPMPAVSATSASTS